MYVSINTGCWYGYTIDGDEMGCGDPTVWLSRGFYFTTITLTLHTYIYARTHFNGLFCYVAATMVTISHILSSPESQTENTSDICRPIGPEYATVSAFEIFPVLLILRNKPF